MSESLLSYGDDALDHVALGGSNLGGCWSLSRTPPHLSGSSRPAGNERSSILILKATAIYLFFLIATQSPVLGSFYSHTSHLCSSVHQDFTLEIRYISWPVPSTGDPVACCSCSNSWLFTCINFFQVPLGVRVQAIPSQVQIYKSSTSPLQVLSTFVP